MLAVQTDKKNQLLGLLTDTTKDLCLNYFFIEKCIPGIFPCEILEKKKQMSDIHALFFGPEIVRLPLKTK